MTNLPRDGKRALELIRRHGRTTPSFRSTTDKVVSLAGIAGPALAATLFVQEIRRQEKVSETRKARDRE